MNGNGKILIQQDLYLSGFYVLSHWKMKIEEVCGS